MASEPSVLYFVDRKSFPIKCAELDDFLSLIRDDCKIEMLQIDSPTTFFRESLKKAEKYDLVIPVTRNLFVRDRLRMEGVNLIVCL